MSSLQRHGQGRLEGGPGNRRPSDMLAVRRQRDDQSRPSGASQVTPDATWTESQFQRWVLEQAKSRGWTVQIALRIMRRGVNSQKGGGWPDLMFVGHGRIFWAELK